MNKTIVIGAYACEPYKGSEQGVGWNWALQIAKRNKVIVITRSNNEPVIYDYLKKHLIDNITFYYCDVPDSIRKYKKVVRVCIGIITYGSIIVTKRQRKS